MDAGAFPGDPVVPGDLVVKNLPCNGEDLQIWSLVRELRPHIPQGHYWSHVPQWKIPHDETKTPRAATETQYSQIYTYILFKKKDQCLACTEPILWNLWQVLQWRDKSTDFTPVRDDVSSDTASQVWPRIQGVHWRKAGAYTHRWGGKPLVLARLSWSNIRTPYHVLISHLLFMSHLLPKGCDTAFSEKHRYERIMQPLQLNSGGESQEGKKAKEGGSL